jgi:hypothetical protein
MNLEPAAPVCPRLVQFYSWRFYKERVKATFEETWARINRNLEDGEELLVQVKIRNEVTKRCWDLETDAFRAEVEVALERKHNVAVESHKASLKDVPAQSAQEYHLFVFISVWEHNDLLLVPGC